MSRGKGNDLQHEVLAELEWDPQIDASKIGVTVPRGDVVDLRFVRCACDRFIELAKRRVMQQWL